MQHSHKLKDFLPLIGVLAFVFFWTWFSVTYQNMEPMLAFMGWFFIVFGALKVFKLRSFVDAYQTYDVIAQKNRVYGYVYPFLELFFGFSYLYVWQIERVSVVVVIVMLVSAYGVHQKLRQKEEVPCACLGTVFKIPMTWVTLGEDLLMAVMAFLLIL